MGGEGYWPGMSTSLRSPAVHDAVDQLAGLEALDEPAKAVGKAVRDVVPPARSRTRSAASGSATRCIRCSPTCRSAATRARCCSTGWAGATARAAADRLIGLGILFTLPAAATGMTEWADSEAGDEDVRRVGLIHAALNVGATALFGASLAARQARLARRGQAPRAGGRGRARRVRPPRRAPSYAEGVGVDQTAFEEPPEDWTPALRDDDLPEGESRFAEVGGVAVLGGPPRGRRLRDLQPLLAPRRAARRGRAARRLRHLPVARVDLQARGRQRRPGPAAYPQPRWETRVRDGVIEIKAR